MAMIINEETEGDFSEWLLRQIGKCKWIVARASKKRRDEGYDRFLTRRKYNALVRAMDKETIPVDETSTLSLHLTEPNKDLGDKRRRTPPGMAFWSGTGPAGKTCRECARWNSKGYLAGSGLLKDSPCDKYTSMMNGETGGLIPHYTATCKYFEQAAIPRPLENPK